MRNLEAAKTDEGDCGLMLFMDRLSVVFKQSFVDRMASGLVALPS